MTGVTPLHLSLSAYGGVTTREALAVYWNAGVRHVELAIGPRPDAGITAAVQAFAARGMAFRAHHAVVFTERPRPFDLAQAFDAAHFARLLDWLAAAGVVAYSVHAGSHGRAAPREDAYARFLAHVRALAAMSAARGIALGVETMYALPPWSDTRYLLDDLASVARFRHDAPDVPLVVDLAHLRLWPHDAPADKLRLLDLPPGGLLEVHLSDNDGRHDTHCAIGPQTWWLPARDRIPRGVPCVLESRMNRRPAEDIRREYARVGQWLVDPRDRPGSEREPPCSSPS